MKITNFLTKDDLAIIRDEVKAGYGADKLFPFFSHKYPDITMEEINSAIRKLGLSGLRQGCGDSPTFIQSK